MRETGPLYRVTGSVMSSNTPRKEGDVTDVSGITGNSDLALPLLLVTGLAQSLAFPEEPSFLPQPWRPESTLISSSEPLMDFCLRKFLLGLLSYLKCDSFKRTFSFPR